MKKYLILLFVLLASSAFAGTTIIKKKSVASTSKSIRGTSATSYLSRTDTTASPWDVTSALTMEAQVKKSASPGYDIVIEKDATYALAITSTGNLRCRMSFTGEINVDVVDPDAWSTYADGWHAVACVKDGSGHRLYVDGTRKAEQTYSLTNIVTNNNDLNMVGGWWDGQQLNENVSEIRVSNSARYTGTSYTPATAQFTTDGSTIALYHLGDSSGSTVDDSSANNLDLTVNGTYVFEEDGPF